MVSDVRQMVWKNLIKKPKEIFYFLLIREAWNVLLSSSVLTIRIEDLGNTSRKFVLFSHLMAEISVMCF